MTDLEYIVTICYRDESEQEKHFYTMLDAKRWVQKHQAMLSDKTRVRWWDGPRAVCSDEY